jgi:PAS domain S-box-containing protein
MEAMESFCRRALEDGPDGCLIFENGRCVFYSPNYHRIVRYEPGEPLDSDATALKRLLHPEDRDRVLDTFDTAVRHRRRYASYAFRGRVRDGSYRWREDSARFVYDENGSHIGTYVVARDIEGRLEDPFLVPRGAEEESRELRHRVKNDLELVRSLLSLQARSLGEEPAKEAILEAADRVGALVSLYETMHCSAGRESQDCAELLETQLRYLRKKAPQKLVTIYGHASPDRRIPIRLARTVSIMVNELVTNAIKHARRSGEKLSVEVYLEKREGHLELTVRDSGPGFPEHVILGEGTGLGLQIVRNMARQHGGRVTLSNDSGAVAHCTFHRT